MKAITLYQPWAWAFCRAGKLVENRDWNPGRQLRHGEPVAIHASVKLEAGYMPPGRPEPEGDFVRLLDPRGRRIAPDPSDAALALGAVVGVAIFDRAVRKLPRSSSQADWLESSAAWPWLFSRCDALTMPVPCRGNRKIWKLRPRDEERVLELWYRDLM